MALGFAPPQKLNHRLGTFEQFAHRARALGADQIIGILALGQHCKTQRLASFQQRQSDIDQPHCRTQPGLVAIKGNDRFRMDAPNRAQLIFGDRRAKRGDRAGKSGLGQGNNIHVTFSDDQWLTLARGFARGPVIKQAAAFVKERGFRRIEIFRPCIWVHRATAQRNGTPPRIADRKDDASAKTVKRGAAIVRFHR